MLAQKVEAQLSHRAYIEGERLVDGRGHEAVGPVALVEHASQEERLVVEVEARYALRVRLDAHGAEGAVASRAIVSEGELEVVKVRIVRAPKMRFGHIQRELAAPILCRRFGARPRGP